VWVRPNFDAELDEFARISDELNVSLDFLRKKFDTATMRKLSDEDWHKLENTDSYGISLRRAKKLAKIYDRDIKTIINAFHENDTLPAPIILELPNGELTLVGGNTRLMVASALKHVPTVLWMKYNDG